MKKSFLFCLFALKCFLVLFTLMQPESSQAGRRYLLPGGAPDYPKVPGNLTATVGNTEVVLHWNTPPELPGHAIYQYRVGRDGWMHPDWNSIPGSGVQTKSHTVKGLTNGVTYTFEVRAILKFRTAPGAASGATSLAHPGPIARVHATPMAAPNAGTGSQNEACGEKEDQSKGYEASHGGLDFQHPRVADPGVNQRVNVTREIGDITLQELADLVKPMAANFSTVIGVGVEFNKELSHNGKVYTVKPENLLKATEDQLYVYYEDKSCMIYGVHSIEDGIEENDNYGVYEMKLSSGGELKIALANSFQIPILLNVKCRSDLTPETPVRYIEELLDGVISFYY